MNRHGVRSAVDRTGPVDSGRDVPNQHTSSSDVAGPGRWCTRCGARPGIAGTEWICRICVARSTWLPDHAIIRNERKCPLPPGVPEPARGTALPGCACSAAGAGTGRTGRRASGAADGRRTRRNRYRAAHPLTGGALEAHRGKTCGSGDGATSPPEWCAACCGERDHRRS